MLKKALIGMSLLAASSVSSAAFIVSQDVVTGAEMTGMSVTVTFADGTSEMGTWATISNTLLNTGDPILDRNGFSGGVTANTWSLVQAGSTTGGFDNFENAYGIWTLTNIDASSAITGFSVSGTPGLIAFDNNPDEGFPGSKTGQAFVSDLAATATYFDQVDVAFDDLFFGLSVVLGEELAVGSELRYFADTDQLAQAVSAPAGIALTLAGLALFTRRQSRK